MPVRIQSWFIVGSLVAAIFLSNPYAFIPDPTAANHKSQPKPDFLAFYAAGVLVQEDAKRLYDDRRQAEIQSEAIGEEIKPDRPGFMPFVYPAVLAVPFLPLSMLPYSTAFVVMLGVNVLLCGFAFGLLATRFSLSASASRLLVLCGALSISVILTLANGQVSFIPLMILVMVIASIREGSDRAGFWTGLLALKPTFLPVLLIWFAARRQWKALLYAGGTAAVIGLCSVLLTGFRALEDYSAMSVKMATAQYATVNTARMTNLKAFSEFIGAGNLIGLILSILVVGVLIWRAKDSSRSSCAALVVAMLLVAPHIHYQDLNPLWIVVALALIDVEKVMLTQGCLLLGGTLFTTFMVFVTAANQWNLPIFSIGLLGLFVALTFRPLPGKSLQPQHAQWKE